MCSIGANLGPAQQSYAGLLHFERWEHAIGKCSPKPPQLRGAPKSFLWSGIQSFLQRCPTIRRQTVRQSDIRLNQPAALPTANLRLLRSHLLPKEGGYPFAAPPLLES